MAVRCSDEFNHYSVFYGLVFSFIFLEGFSTIFAQSKTQPVITVFNEDVLNGSKYFTLLCTAHNWPAEGAVALLARHN